MLKIYYSAAQCQNGGISYKICDRNCGETWRNVEKRGERERERERLKTLPYTINFQNFSQNLKQSINMLRIDYTAAQLHCLFHLIEVLMTFWQQPNDSANQYGPNNDYPISLHRVNHKTFATLQNGSVDPKKLQSPKFICIDDILAFATYINVHDIDKFLRRNFEMHITNTSGNQPSLSILPIQNSWYVRRTRLRTEG